MTEPRFLFVYGTLKRGHRNHDRMKEAGGVYIGDETTPGTLYVNRRIPVLVRPNGGRVFGEIFQVPPEGLAMIDRMEGHPSFYTRETITTKYGPTGVYIMPQHKVKSHWEVITRGVYA